jgi:hypothetical protein
MAWSTLTARSAGDAILASDQNITAANFVELAPFFSTFTNYTPTLTQSGAVTKTSGYCRYLQIGKLVIAQVNLSCTGAGTGGNVVLVGLPIAATASLAVGSRCGTGHIFDASTSTRYVGVAEIRSSTTVGLVTDVTGVDAWGAAPSIALANTDQINFAVMYEAA